MKCHINDCNKIKGKQIVKMPKNGDYIKFKYIERKIKSPFMTIYEFYRF